MPYYKSALAEYGISFVLSPLYDVRGNIIPLVLKLLSDDEWVPVYLWGNATIFVKSATANYTVIYRCGIPKDYFVGGMLDVVDARIQTTQKPFHLYITKGDLYLKIGQPDKAIQAYQKSLEIYPNPVAEKRLNMLRGSRNDAGPGLSR
ncbi:MAG: tetratricopeptide repeat protein [Nitrospirae bacterium]|nr:tetratricopeptide repeat protein [Nitrospirota bacterium]